MLVMVDSSQERAGSSQQKSSADELFASTSSTSSDPLDAVPANWTRITPKSSMRLAEYKVETTSGFYNVIVFKNIGQRLFILNN